MSRHTENQVLFMVIKRSGSLFTNAIPWRYFFQQSTPFSDTKHVLEEKMHSAELLVSLNLA